MTTAIHTKSDYMNESGIYKKIPYSHFVNSETIETKNGNLIQIIKVDGLLADTLNDEWIDIEKRLRNSLLISLTDSTTAFYFHTIRRKTAVDISGVYRDDFLQNLHNKWQDKLSKQNFYINEHYITLIKKPPIGKINKLSDLYKGLFSSFNAEQRDQYRKDAINSLNKISKQILTQFSHYGVKKLCDTQALSFLYYLINLDDRNMATPESDLAYVLPTKRLFFDSTAGTMALRGITNQIQYAAVLSIKNYCHASFAGMLDKLLDLQAEIVISQSFCPIEKETIRNKIKETQRNQAQSDDGQTTASNQISDVLDDLGSQEATLGEHQFNIICKAANKAELEQKMADLDAMLNQVGMIGIREDAGLQPAFFASLPGNLAYRTRVALISSKNMAGLASFHNASLGKATGNYWGEAVTVLETISGSPYYFNFHVMDVGNTFMIGPMGSGKTLLESFLLAQSMRFGGRLVAFDKDRGMEIFIRAQGGQYSQLKLGQPTGFSPFQLEDTPDNRFLLFKLMRKIAVQSGVIIDSEVEETLQIAINGAFNLPKPDRLLRNIASFLGMKKVGSLRSAFDNWVNEGTYAWIFDNEQENLSLNHDVLGFDMTSVLDDTLVAGVIYEYLFHRIESLMDGSKMRIVVAEGWRALQDESFREKIRDWSSTPRKKNAFMIMDTQSPSDIAQSELACKLIQETVTQIYFANPTAEYQDYVGKFKLSEKEYHIVKTLNKSSRFFLMKQGKHSVVVRADLREGFDDEIAVLSGRERNVRLLDEIRSKLGNTPKAWIPEFYNQIKKSERSI